MYLKYFFLLLNATLFESVNRCTDLPNLRLILVYLFILLSTQISFGQGKYDHLITEIQAIQSWEDKQTLYDSLVSLALSESHDSYTKTLKLVINETQAIEQYDFASDKIIELAASYYKTTFAPDSTILLVDSVLQWTNQLSESHKGQLMEIRGHAHFYKNNWDSAALCYEKGAEIFEQLNDSSQKHFGTNYSFAAEMNMNLGNYNKSSKQLEKAYKIFEYQDDSSELVSALGLSANLYSANGFLEKAMSYYKKTLDLADKIGDRSISHYYVNYSVTASRLGKDSLELALLKKALSSLDTSSRPGLESQHVERMRLVWAFANQNQPDSALYYFQLVHKNNHKFKGAGWIQERYLMSKAYAHYCQGKYQMSIKTATNVITQSSGQGKFGVTLEMEHLIHKAFLAQGNYKMVFNHYSNFAELRDSLFSVEKSNAMAYLETQFETERKERIISDRDNEIQLLASSNLFRQRLTWLSGIVAVLLFGSVILFRSRKFALRSKNLHQHYSRLLLRSHEDERMRISRDLHDSVGQSLMLIKNKVVLSQDDDTVSMVSKALEEIRTISKALHPAILENIGLTSSIKKIVKDADELTGIFFSQQIENIDGIFSQEYELQIYRIVQESINNMIKHAQTDSALVQVSQDENKVTLLVKDYGIGFDISEGHLSGSSLGMKTLKERTQILNGKILIESTLNKGTSICLILNKNNNE